MNATVGGLFDGIGLLAYGLHLAGWSHSWLCEVDPWRRELLELRWPGVPIYDDVRAVDARAERPLLIAGGFPCKGASTAGLRNGFDHPETVLWREMARAVRELRPRYVLVENVANLLAVRDGAVWGEVLGDLASLGYDTVWDCVPAAAFGAPHLRDRVIAVATYADGEGERRDAGERSIARGRSDARGDADDAANADSSGRRAIVGNLRPRQPDTDGLAFADAKRVGQPRRDSVRKGRSQAERCGAASTDADGGRLAQQPQRNGGTASEQPGPSWDDAQRHGVRVAWGDFKPAISRWEAVAGPAPEPLVRRVDARSTRKVERSRLSALGDGVQVQLGQLAGEYILGLERERLAA